MTNQEILDQCDPGIRSTVAWLWSLGFKTTDSGDGVAKFDSPGWDPDTLFPLPHVSVQCSLDLNAAANMAEQINDAAMVIKGEYRIEVTLSLPDGICTVLFFPEKEWIKSLEATIEPGDVEYLALRKVKK